METVRGDLVQEARGWIGTKHVHLGRQKGVGVDCIGLMTCVPRRQGWPCYDEVSYSRTPSPRRFMEAMAKGLDPITAEEAIEGDVIVFWTHKPHIPQHVGIIVPRENDKFCRWNIIHTNAVIGRVVEHALNGTWLERIHSYWRYKGIDEWQV